LIAKCKNLGCFDIGDVKPEEIAPAEEPKKRGRPRKSF
jgi:hypothetical protein